MSCTVPRAGGAEPSQHQPACAPAPTAGVTEQVAVRTTGTGSVLVDAASEDVQISGSSSGTGGVLYNRGQCSVTVSAEGGH